MTKEILLRVPGIVLAYLFVHCAAGHSTIQPLQFILGKVGISMSLPDIISFHMIKTPIILSGLA